MSTWRQACKEDYVLWYVSDRKRPSDQRLSRMLLPLFSRKEPLAYFEVRSVMKQKTDMRLAQARPFHATAKVLMRLSLAKNDWRKVASPAVVWLRGAGIRQARALLCFQISLVYRTCCMQFTLW